MTTTSDGLRRALGRSTMVMITVGAMVGSGIFATPHDVALRVRDPTWTLALWVVGGALALLGALSFAELGAAIPETGGMYHYLRRAYGRFAAFAFAWAMLVVLVPSSVGYFAQVAARHVVDVVGGGARAQAAIAIAIVTVLVGVNLAGVRAGASVQNAATIVKYAGVVAVALAGAAVRASIGAAHESPATPSLLAALVPILWAYDGWVDVTSIAGEARHPARDLPFSLIVGTLLVAALYLLANVGYLHALGIRGLASTEVPADEIAAQVAGTGGRAAASMLVAVATFGGCAVALLTGTRVVFALARSDGIFGPLGHASQRAVPDRALVAVGVLAVAYLVSPLERLGEVFVVGAWPFYAVGALATIVLRRKEPALERPFHTPMYPVPIVLFAIGSVAIVVGYAVAEPMHTAMSLGVIALAAPVYLVRVRARSLR